MHTARIRTKLTPLAQQRHAMATQAIAPIRENTIVILKKNDEKSSPSPSTSTAAPTYTSVS